MIMNGLFILLGWALYIVLIAGGVGYGMLWYFGIPLMQVFIIAGIMSLSLVVATAAVIIGVELTIKFSVWRENKRKRPPLDPYTEAARADTRARYAEIREIMTNRR